MSSLLFDAGDFQRLDREKTLTEESPRQLPVDDRSPWEDPIEQNDNDFDIIFDGLLDALNRRLQ